MHRPGPSTGPASFDPGPDAEDQRAVELRAADARDRWEASWYRERRQEPKLVRTGLMLVVDERAIAAPVRGQRHGGYVCVDAAADVPRLRDALTRRPGFPDVRVPPQPLPGRGAGGASFQRA
ncbi:DUF6302 family protein [Streptomyces sp. bgisy034]|uniref:DUF6302 family protein n=1 Tax=Streptomyces sp. bgisy034 TaxID=3413774 RepID=UPI003EB7FB4E